jgi:hypothetical protein
MRCFGASLTVLRATPCASPPPSDEQEGLGSRYGRMARRNPWAGKGVLGRPGRELYSLHVRSFAEGFDFAALSRCWDRDSDIAVLHGLLTSVRCLVRCLLLFSCLVLDGLTSFSDSVSDVYRCELLD